MIPVTLFLSYTLGVKPVVAIFAHPDDEAFGPAGSLAKFAQERDVYLICITNGDAGQNALKEGELGSIRAEELKKSAGILGIKEVYFLGYKDGTLSNNVYHEVVEKIEPILKKYQPDTLLTFNLLGISGHLDHIFASLISTYLFYKLDFIADLLYYGEVEELVKIMRSDYFIYMPPGFQKGEANMEVDITKYWEAKLKAYAAHQSQQKDAQWLIEILQKFPKKEYFKKVTK